jgi:hypothetical protein
MTAGQISMSVSIRRTTTYHKLVSIFIETNSLYTLLKNRCRVVPGLSNGMVDHLLGLATVELRLGRLTRDDNANFCW